MRKRNINLKGAVSVGMIALLLLVPAILILNGVHGTTDPCTGFPQRPPMEMDGSCVEGFIENGGQWDESIHFASRTDFGHIAFSRDSVLFDIRMISEEDSGVLEGSVLHMSFLGSNPVTPEGKIPMGCRSNFIMGKDPENWGIGIETYSEVIYNDLWDGIDLVYYNTEAGLKYEYRCRPGSDPANIGFLVNGAEVSSIQGDRMELMTPIGVPLIDGGLICFYSDSSDETVDIAFLEDPDGKIHFDIGEYDDERTLIIDPLVFSTYIGGIGDEGVACMTNDDQGNLYMAGATSSMDFPVTKGAYSTKLTNATDGYVSKILPNGSAMVFSTFIGGMGFDEMRGIDLGPDGDIFIAGISGSKDFPTTKGAFNETLNNYSAPYTSDFVVVRMDPTGSTLSYSTFIGGTFPETMNNIDMIMVDEGGCAVIAGDTMSGDYPVTKDAFDKYNNASGMGWRNGKVVLTKLASDGSSLLYSTYIGGSSWDSVGSLWLGDEDIVYLAGDSSSDDFPISKNAFDSTSGWGKLYVMKFNMAASSVIYSTFLGGNGFQAMSDIIVDGAGRAIVTGQTNSGDFPTTEDAYDTIHHGEADVFVTAFDPSGSSLYFSTFLGGQNMDMGKSVYLDQFNNVMITGNTGSSDYPQLIGDKKPDGSEGDTDVIVSLLNKTGEQLLFSTLIGGSRGNGISEEWGDSILPSKNGKMVVSGITTSSDFPVTRNCFDSQISGNQDIFLFEIDQSIPPTTPMDFQIHQGDGYLNATWKVPDDDGGMPITGYTVLRGERKDGLEVHMENITNTYLNDTDIEVGNTYFYCVFALNDAGSGIPTKIVSSKAVSVPTPPQRLIIDEEPGRITLSWVHPYFDGALPLLGYRIYKHIDDYDGTMVIDIPGYEMDYHDDEVVDGTNYTYYVTACNSIGESLPSNVEWTIPMGLPSPPLNLTSEIRSDSILVKWEPPFDDGGSQILYYRVYQGTPRGDEIIWRYVEVEEKEFNDTLVQIGNEYHYYVTAVNQEGASPPSNEITASPRSRPSAPENIEAGEGSSYVVISWTEPSFHGGLDIKGYRIYRKASGGDLNMISELDPETFIHKDQDVENGKRYEYQVTAFNDEGESQPSDTVEAVPADIPGTPEQFSVSVDAGSNTLTWSEPSDSGGAPLLKYIILRRSGEGDLEEISRPVAGTLEHIDTDVSPGIDYTYVMKALNRIGLSDPCDEITATAVGVPCMPKDLAITSGDGEVEIGWSCPDNTGGCDLTGFEIHRIKASTGEKVLLSEPGPSETSFKDNDVANGETYTYIISSVNQFGPSEEADIGSTTPLGLPGSPQDLEVEVEGSMVSLKWSAPEDDGGLSIRSYLVMRKGETGQYAEIAMVGGSKLQFTDHEPKDPGTYTYSVISVNRIGQSENCTGYDVFVKDVEDGDESLLQEQSGLFVTIPIILLLFVLLVLVLVRKKRKHVPDLPEPTPVYQEPPVEIFDGDLEEGYVEAEVPVLEDADPEYGADQEL